MRAAYDAVRRGGTACIVGVGGMDQEVSFNAFEIFFGEKTFMGSYYGSADVRSDFHRLLRLWKAGQLDLEGMITQGSASTTSTTPSPPMKRGEVIRRSSPSDPTVATVRGRSGDRGPTSRSAPLHGSCGRLRRETRTCSSLRPVTQTDHDDGVLRAPLVIEYPFKPHDRAGHRRLPHRPARAGPGGRRGRPTGG